MNASATQNEITAFLAAFEKFAVDLTSGAASVESVVKFVTIEASEMAIDASNLGPILTCMDFIGQFVSRDSSTGAAIMRDGLKKFIRSVRHVTGIEMTVKKGEYTIREWTRKRATLTNENEGEFSVNINGKELYYNTKTEKPIPKRNAIDYFKDNASKFNQECAAMAIKEPNKPSSFERALLKYHGIAHPENTEKEINPEALEKALKALESEHEKLNTEESTSAMVSPTLNMAMVW